MSKDIAKGMIYLHSLQPPIIHRDLKSLKYVLFFFALKIDILYIIFVSLLLDVPFNDSSYNYNIKIADFGLSRT